MGSPGFLRRIRVVSIEYLLDLGHLLTDVRLSVNNGSLAAGGSMVPVAPADCAAMQALVDATRTALLGDEHHPILVIAAFVARFLAIHPFQDGNGRLSRALTTLLLLRSGYLYVPYASLERVIEHNKDVYYERLRRAQTTWGSDQSDLAAWMAFFVDCLIEQKNVLLHRLDREQLLDPLAPLSAAILALALERGRVTVREVVTNQGANRNTIKLHLKQLVAAGQLVQRGRGRGTWYERV